MIDTQQVTVVNSVQEVRDIVRQANAEGQAVYPVGGRTMLDLGLPATKSGYTVGMTGLNQVIDYPARDMTITVQAGITLQALADVLKSEKQWLPIDVPLPSQATLGGAIATNASGPGRLGFGTFRDYVIGISAVNDEGQEIKGGGRVVKNVAGYDMMKLFTGSLGTLGVITQVTLKLKPATEASCLVVLPVTLDQAATVLDNMVGTRTRPVCMELLDPASCKKFRERDGLKFPGSADSWALLLGFDDNAQAVRWQVEQIRKELPAGLASSLQEWGGGDHILCWSLLRDYPLWHDAVVSFKANVTPAATVPFCKAAAELAPKPLIRAHAGNGIIHGHFEEITIDQTKAALESLGALAAKCGGNVVVTRCPADWKPRLPIWGRSTGDRILMKAIKNKLDPRGIFNPGRFVDGI